MTSPKDDGPKPTDKGVFPASSSTAKPDLSKSEPVKAGATGSSALPGGTTRPADPKDARPSEPLKPGPTGSGVVPSVGAGPKPSDPIKPSEPPKPSEPAKPLDAAKSSGTDKSPELPKPAPSVPPAGTSASPSAAKPASASPAIAGSAPLKPGATGSSAVPPAPASAKPGEAAKVESPVKAGPTGSSAIKPEVASAGAKPGDIKPADTKSTDTKPADAKPSDPKPSDSRPSDAKPGAGPSRVTETASLTEGPILDMKAKRVPEPADAAKGGPKPDTVKDGPGQAKPSAGPAKGAPEPVAARGGAGLGAVATSGLLGGLIGAGLLYGVTTYQRGTDPRLEGLDKAVAGLATKESVGALDKRLAASEQALKPLKESVGRAEATAKTADERAQDALRKAGTAPAAEGGASAPAAPIDLVARLDALDQRISALQEEPGREGTAEMKATPAPAADPAPLAALDERIKTLEAAGEKGSAPGPDLTQKFTTLQGEIEARAKANETADAGLAKRLDEMQKALEARVAAATQAVQDATQAGKQAAEAGQARADEIAKGLDRKLQEQAERIAGLDKALDQSAKAATVQSALRIVAADRIATALDAGQPYPEALASLRTLEPADSKRIAALAPFADKGGPNAAALAAEFRGVTGKIAEAKRAAQARALAETGSVGDRLLNMASSIVQVKRADAPTPAVSGASAPGGEASTGQVQAALDRGDLAAAAQAFAGLPEEAKAQAGDFGARLAARAEAGRAAQSLLADAFTGLPPAR